MSLEKTDVVNNLISNEVDLPLSARMGRMLAALIGNKQDKLVSGTNIKTINGISLVEPHGPRDIIIPPGVVTEVSGNIASGSSTAALSIYAARQLSARISNLEQSGIDPNYNPGSGISVEIIDGLTSFDKLAALSANQGRLLDAKKQDKLVSGNNIRTINGASLLGSGNLIIEGGGSTQQNATIITIDMDWNTLRNNFNDLPIGIYILNDFGESIINKPKMFPEADTKDKQRSYDCILLGEDDSKVLIMYLWGSNLIYSWSLWTNEVIRLGGSLTYTSEYETEGLIDGDKRFLSGVWSVYHGGNWFQFA